MEEDFEDISEDILAKEKKATEGLLPTKSRAVYDNHMPHVVMFMFCCNSLVPINLTINGRNDSLRPLITPSYFPGRNGVVYLFRIIGVNNVL